MPLSITKHRLGFCRFSISSAIRTSPPFRHANLTRAKCLLRRDPRRLQHAINTSDPDSQLGRDPLTGYPLPVEFKNLVALGASGRFPTLIFSLRLGLGHSFPLSLQHHLAFELADRGQEVQHQPSGSASPCRFPPTGFEGSLLSFPAGR